MDKNNKNRFSLTPDNNFKDEGGLLTITNAFNENDIQSVKELISFMNSQDQLLQSTILKYGETLNELNELKMRISRKIADEIKDCQILSEVDHNDPYLQGRLVEIHNLMRVLL